MKPLILLHGALGLAAQLDELSELLKAHHNCHTMSFSGHGGTRMPDAFSIGQFANDVLEFMESQRIEKADFFGYSMGGYVALFLAANHPEKVGKIVTLATKFAWTPDIASKEIRMLDPQKIAEKIPAFAKALELRHAPNDWKEVLIKTGAMMTEMGGNPPLSDSDFRSIKNPVLLCRGENDLMVSEEETERVRTLLPDSGSIKIPATEHAFEKVNLQNIAPIITNFIR